jgi:Mg2+-importing ATPase
LLRVFNADSVTFQTAWFVVSLLTELAVLFVLRTREKLRLSRPSHLLIASSIGVALIALLLPYAGPVAGIFSFDPLPFPIVAAALLIVAGYVAATEALKRRFYRPVKPPARRRRRGSP